MAVLRTIGPGKPVVIRTLDLGADKFFDQVDRQHPASGTRRSACAASACACAT